ncbi:MAG TPA: hypothetical protein PLH43_08720 [Acetivibrio sp.]|nr:hypothetical protein [Acetivibrio sp.]
MNFHIMAHALSGAGLHHALTVCRLKHTGVAILIFHHLDSLQNSNFTVEYFINIIFR